VTSAEHVDASSAVTMVIDGVIDGQRYSGQSVTLQPGVHQIGDGARLTLAKGAVVPHVTSLPELSNNMWSMLLPAGGRSHPLYITYSLMIALFLGTMDFHTWLSGSAPIRTAALPDEPRWSCWVCCRSST
jgi:hypothetical protein